MPKRVLVLGPHMDGGSLKHRGVKMVNVTFSLCRKPVLGDFHQTCIKKSS